MLLTLPAGADLDSSLDRFSRWGDDLMDRWDGVRLLRPIRLRSELIGVEMSPVAPGLTEVSFSRPDPPVEAIAAVRAMVVDDSDAIAALAANDPVVASLHRAHPGLHPIRYLDPLGALLSFVTAQQVNLSFALSVRRATLQRLGTRIELGTHFLWAPDPVALAEATMGELRALRLTSAKARCLSALARAVVSGELEFGSLATLSDAEVVRTLTKIPGLGPWTAAQYLGRVLGRPILVADDLGVRRAVQLAYGLSERPTPERVREITCSYGAAALRAQQLLLFGLARADAAARRLHARATVVAADGPADHRR